MDENKVSVEELKEETKQTFNRVKDEIKDANFKAETIEVTNFIKDMFMDPVDAVRNVTNEVGPKLITVIMLVIGVMLSNLLKNIMWGFENLNIFDSLWEIITSLTSGVCIILVPAFIAYVFNRNSDRSLLTSITLMAMANVPTIFVNVFSALAGPFYKLAGIIGIINHGLEVACVVLTYFALKAYYKDEDDLFIFKFVIIEVASGFIMMLLKLLNVC